MNDPSDYCREIEAYLCRKNDGHLIRVVGPAFDLVSSWSVQGIPIKIACRGIDRYFERYYAKGPRRRPVRIDFCEADVLDAFDAWRRTTGLTASPTAARPPSLAAHLTKVMLGLTAARTTRSIGPGVEQALEDVSRDVETIHASARSARGDARKAIIDALAKLDRTMVEAARASLDDEAQRALQREAEEDLGGFRAAMPADAFARARDKAIDRLVRDRFGLPTIVF